MREQEAVRIREILEDPEFGNIRTIVELGSSDAFFRETSQPHIDANIHGPLKARGVRLVTTDLKDGNGIDIDGDIYDPAVQAKLMALKPDVILCCNILEHLTDRASFAKACDQLLPKGRFLLVTVPYSYPYHLDPIDTMFRPSPDEIAALFPGYRIVRGEIFEAGNFGSDMRRKGSSLIRQFLRTLVRSISPWEGVQAVKARWHRWLWLNRPYKISLVLLQK